MCVFQCLGPSILIMDENNREFDQNGLDCFLLPRNQAIQTFEVPTSTGNFCTAASHSRFVYSEDLSVGCLHLRSPDCPCARLSCPAPVRFPALRRCPFRSVGGAVDGGVGARGVDSLPSAPRLCSIGGWRLSLASAQW